MEQLVLVVAVAMWAEAISSESAAVVVKWVVRVSSWV
jgi:hypothetical protein